MNHERLTLVLTLACVWALSSLGQASAQESKASPPLDPLKAFLGAGTCTGKVLARGKNPGHPTEARYHGEETLDGRWIVFHYDEDRTATNPKPFRLVQYFGYDEATKRYVAVLFDNSESSYSAGASEGWKGDTLTVDTSATTNGAKIAFRDVFTRDGANGVNGHTGWERDAGGKWVETDEEACKKSL